MIWAILWAVTWWVIDWMFWDDVIWEWVILWWILWSVLESSNEERTYTRMEAMEIAEANYRVWNISIDEYKKDLELLLKSTNNEFKINN